MKEHSFSENNDLLPDLFAENAEELPADSALRRLIQGDETADEQAELLRQRGNQRYRLGCRLLDRGNDPGADLTLPGGEQSVATLRKRAHALFHQAMASYTEALALPGVSSTVRGALYLNRAEVHRRLGNYARGLHDAQQCIRSCGLEHPKAFYRASACALALGKLPEARTFCQQGLERTKAPEHVLERRALQRLEERIAEEMVRAQRLLAEKDALLQQRVDQSQRLLDTLERQRIRLGMPLFAQQKKVSNWQPKPVPVARDEPNPDSESTVSIKFSWPFMVVYPLVQRSDFFENVDDDAELQALFSDLLPVEGPPALTFDPEGRYRCDRVAFWYATQWTRTLVDVGDPALLRDLTRVQDNEFCGSLLPPEEQGTWKQVLLDDIGLDAARLPRDTVCVRTLRDLVTQPDYIVPMFPVLFVAPRGATPTPFWLAAGFS